MIRFARLLAAAMLTAAATVALSQPEAAADTDVTCPSIVFLNSTQGSRYITLSDTSGIWTNVSVGHEVSGLFRKIRVVADHDVILSAYGFEGDPDPVVLHDNQWYAITRWDCTPAYQGKWWGAQGPNGWWD